MQIPLDMLQPQAEPPIRIIYGPNSTGAGCIVRLLTNGWDVLRMFWRATDRYPELFIPLLSALFVFVPPLLIVQVTGAFQNANLLPRVIAAAGLGAILVAAVGAAGLVLLELLRQIESDHDVQVAHAFRVLPNSGLSCLFPLVALWSFGWILIWLPPDRTGETSIGNEVADDDGSPPTTRQIWRQFQRVPRGSRPIALFLVLPGLMWQNLGIRQALDRALRILQQHDGFKAAGAPATGGVTRLLLTPFFIVAVPALAGLLPLPSTVLAILFLYACFAWSLGFFIQQTFIACLYLWHLNWERATSVESIEILAITEVEAPHLLRLSLMLPEKNQSAP